MDAHNQAYAALGHELFIEKLMAAQYEHQALVKNLHKHSYSFGTAVDSISTRDCREYRDRFIAICGFFPEWTHDNTVQNLPNDPVQACLWVARKSLENGDYTPLLLINSGEREVSGANWLTCHERMDFTSWYWGETLAPAVNKPVIDAAKIRMEVQLVGVIERYTMLELPRDDTLTFEYIIREVIEENGTCANCFISCIGRVYKVPTFVKIPPESIDGRATINLDSLSTKLESYVAQNGEETSRRHDIAKEIFDALNLSAESSSVGMSFGRLAWAVTSLRGDCLAYIRCKRCGIRSILRMNMWKQPPEGTQLYRIQGMQFRHSLADGVGIAIHEHRIIGIMMTGAPACECRDSEIVVIE